MKLAKSVFPFFAILILCLASFTFMGVSNCEPVEPVVEDIQELSSTFDGNYFYQFSSLQQAREGLLAVNAALQNQQQGQLSQQELLSLQSSYQRLTDDILASWQNASLILCRPPFCPPPNPCKDRPDGIVCTPLQLPAEALQDFRLPKQWADGRKVELLDNQGETVASIEQGSDSFFERSMRYQMDVPESFTEGTLIITENRDGVETISKVALSVQ